jgi:hypothetical protein
VNDRSNIRYNKKKGKKKEKKKKKEKIYTFNVKRRSGKKKSDNDEPDVKSLFSLSFLHNDQQVYTFIKKHKYMCLNCPRVSIILVFYVCKYLFRAHGCNFLLLM